jgi:serine/threonine protein phosphatase PrpC
VCDGHGLNGHHVSNFIREKLPGKLQIINEYSSILGFPEAGRSVEDGQR